MQRFGTSPKPREQAMIDNYASFIAAIIAFQIVPGPGTLAILNATARHGVRSGMASVLGTITGDLLFMLGAVLGLAAVLEARPAILSTLQWLGIGYLVWLGLKLLRTPAADTQSTRMRNQDHWNCFRQAFAVCLTNPKAILFFMAFFPLFLQPNVRPFTLGLMMAHVSLISFIYQTGLVLMGNAVAARLAHHPKTRVIASRIVGAGLVGFGIKLAFERK